MNLQQYVAANPTKTLTEIQGYELVVDTKQVGSGQARSFFKKTLTHPECSFGVMPLWTLFSAAAQDVTHLMFADASTIIITASDAGSFFGMDIEKEDGKSNRDALDDLVAKKIITQVAADGFIAKTLSVSKPFANVNQEEVDAAKLAVTLYVDTPQRKTHYGQFDSSHPHHVKASNSKLRITARMDEVKTIDTVIKVYVLTDDFEQGEFAKNERSIGTITIKTGELVGALTLETKQASLSRWTQFEGVANTVGSYDMLVISI